MSKSFLPQFTFTQGIFDTDLYQRGDLRSYYSGAKNIENCFCKLTGGVSRRYGGEYVDKLPPKVVAETLSAGSFTLTNMASSTGGLGAANLIDDSRSTTITTNNAGTADFEIFKYDLGSEKIVSYVDIFDAILNSWGGYPGNRYKLMVSTDDSAYTEVTTHTGGFYISGSKQDLSFYVNDTIRYIKLLSNETYPYNSFSISEVKIYTYSDVNDSVQFDEIQVNHYLNAEFYPVLVVFGSYHAHLYYTLGNQTVFLNSIYTGISETYNKTMSLTNGGRGVIIVTDNGFSPKEIRFLFSYMGSSGPSTFRSQTITLDSIPQYEFEVNDITGTGVDITPSATTGYISITASGAYFTTAMVNKKINITPVGRVRIIQFISDTVVKCYVEEKLNDTSAVVSANWKLENGWEPIISATRGWPLCSAFYNGRLYFGGSKSIPGLLLASTIEDNYSFDLGDQSDSDGFYRVVQSRENAQITSMQSYNSLELYTLSGVYVISSSNVTPSSISVQRTSSEGIMQYTDAVEIQNSGSVYIDKTNSEIYQLIYSDDILSYQSKLISQLSGSLVQIKSEPNYAFSIWKGDSNFRANQLFFINGSDQIISATLFLSENVSAFSKLEIKYINPSTDVVTNCTLYTLKSCKNGIAIACKSSGNADKYSLLFLRDGRYLDSSRILTPSGTTVTVGTYWDDEKLSVIADGEYIGEYTVASGAITLPATYNEVEVGWPFYATIETLPVENIEAIGSSIGKLKNISQVYINPKSIGDLYINDNLVFSYDNNNPVTEPFVERNVSGWSREQTLKLSQQKPLEFQIKNILTTVEVNS